MHACANGAPIKAEDIQSSFTVYSAQLQPPPPFQCVSAPIVTAMKQIFFFLGLLVCQAYAGWENITIGFEEKEYCAVEGGSFEFCIVAVSGEASEDFNVTVERSYLQGKNNSIKLYGSLQHFRKKKLSSEHLQINPASCTHTPTSQQARIFPKFL